MRWLIVGVLNTKNLILLALLGCIIVLWGLIGTSPVSAPAPAVLPKEIGALNISGLAYSNYAGERLVSRLEAGTLAVTPRKMGAFRIKSVNELVLREVTFLLDLDPPPASATEENLDQAGQLTLGLKNIVDTKGMGRITQVVIDGLRLDLRKSGEPHLEVTAKGGLFELKQKELRMDGATLKGGQGKVLVSSLVVFDETNKVFRVPGAYVMTVNGKENRAEGALVDMEFNLIPIQ